MASDVDDISWSDPRGDDVDGGSPNGGSDDFGFGESAISFVEPAPELTSSEAVVMPDPFAALELEAASVPIAEPVPVDLPGDGPPDPEADFYDLIL
jgi:hypothetical protein